MATSFKSATRLDRMAIGLSAFCAVHCVGTIVLLGTLSSLGHFFTAPIVHEAGLAVALLLGAIALGAGLRRHRLLWPSIVGTGGLTLMGMALFVDHGVAEAALTVCGVSLVATAHYFNMRADGRRRSSCSASGLAMNMTVNGQGGHQVDRQRCPCD